MDWWQQSSDGEAHSARNHGRPSVTELFAELYVGEYPRPEDFEWLKERFGINAILSLQDDHDLQALGLNLDALKRSAMHVGLCYARTPISDGSADQMAARLDEALAQLKRLIDDGKRVYLHCNGGLNRAPTVAIGFIHASRGISLSEALNYVKQRRACGPFMTVLEDRFGPRDVTPEPPA